jgi:hypothetical protein
MYKINYKNPFKENKRTQTTISFLEANLLCAYMSIVKGKEKDISKEEVQEMFKEACESFKKSYGFSDFMEEQKEEQRNFKECVLNNCTFEMTDIKKFKEGCEGIKHWREEKWKIYKSLRTMSISESEDKIKKLAERMIELYPNGIGHPDCRGRGTPRGKLAELEMDKLVES